MNTILSSKRNHIIHAVCLAVFVIMVVVTIWQIGGSATVAMTNNLGMAVFEVLTAVLALVYWKTISNRKEAFQIWLLLSLGFLFSVVADGIWIYYNLNGIEAPYPSVADPLWVLGYLLQLAALINRNRLLGVWPGKKQIALVLAIALVSFALLFAFVLKPMLADTGTTRAIETVFNFSYPVIDFLILIAACFLVVSMWKGQLSITWNIIAFGFFVQSLADIFFIDASWKGLYYPNDTVNLISCLIDIAYGVGCMAIVVGVSLRQAAIEVKPETIQFSFSQAIQQEKPVLEILPASAEVQQIFEYLYFMVDPEGQVFFFTNNFRKLCSLAGSPDPSWGKPFHQVIGVDPSVVEDLFTQIKHQGGKAIKSTEMVVGNYRVPVVIQAATAQNGMDIYMSYRQDNHPLRIEERTPIETLLMNEVLKTIRGLENATDEEKGATAFFVIEVQELYTFLVRMNGFRVSQILVDKFNRMAAGQKANVRISDGRVQVTDTLPFTIMSELLQLTLQTVRDLTSVEATQGVVQQLNAKLPEHIIRSAQKEGLAL